MAARVSASSEKCSRAGSGLSEANAISVGVRSSLHNCTEAGVCVLRALCYSGANRGLGANSREGEPSERGVVEAQAGDVRVRRRPERERLEQIAADLQKCET